jgi:hypothetical protein
MAFRILLGKRMKSKNKDEPDEQCACERWYQLNYNIFVSNQSKISLTLGLFSRCQT